MDKSDKINQIKEYISKIEEDLILSEKSDRYNKENLMIKNMLECLKLFSEFIEDKNSNSNKDFFISKEQLEQIEINGQKKISDIANELNKVTQVNNVKKLQSVWITDWLLDIGMLQKDAENHRIATQSGITKGITSKLTKSSDGREYNLNYYSEKTQKFIYDNMDNILKFHYDKKHDFKLQYKLLDYPFGKSIDEFILENSNKCIIISIGSCNPTIEKGSYKVSLIYNGINKYLHKNNIQTCSENRCILYGFRDAVNIIKKSTDVILLSSTKLGFQTPQSTNYHICREIIDVLKKKKCTINITSCEGMAKELQNYLTILKEQQKTP